MAEQELPPMPLDLEVRDVLNRWQLTVEHGDARALRSAGAALADILERLCPARPE